MSRVSDVAVVRVILADYVQSDASNKIHMIGGALAVLGSGQLVGEPDSVPRSAAHGVLATVAVPPELYEESATVEIALEDGAGDPVLIHVQGDPAGERQPLRIGQKVKFATPQFKQMPFTVPEGTVPAKAQVVLMFPAGIPMPLDRRYAWRIYVDGETRDDWAEPFYAASITR